MPLPPAFADVLATPEPAQLGPGPRCGVEPQPGLDSKLGKLLDQTKVPSPKDQLIRAVVLLWHDHVEPAHAIAQRVETADGALVHGIMHRREPDYGNAAYWFRRAPGHPVFEPLARAVSGCLKTAGDNQLRRELLSEEKWDPFAFITACEQAAQLPETHPEVKLLREIQRLETNTLLEWLLKGPRD